MNELGRPMVSVRRVDLSSDHREPSAVPAITEAALFSAYSTSMLEQRRCVCGGVVTADPARPAPGVAAHQFSGRHKAWRANHE